MGQIVPGIGRDAVAYRPRPAVVWALDVHDEEELLCGLLPDDLSS